MDAENEEEEEEEESDDMSPFSHRELYDIQNERNPIHHLRPH